jgi:hypothetical protein
LSNLAKCEQQKAKDRLKAELLQAHLAENTDGTASGNKETNRKFNSLSCSYILKKKMNIDF